MKNASNKSTDSKFLFALSLNIEEVLTFYTAVFENLLLFWIGSREPAVMSEASNSNSRLFINTASWNSRNPIPLLPHDFIV